MQPSSSGVEPGDRPKVVVPASVVPQPAGATLPGEAGEARVLGTRPSLAESEAGSVGCRHLCFKLAF